MGVNMQEGKKSRGKTIAIVSGIVVLVVAAAIIFLPRLLSGQAANQSSTVIAYASATTGDVQTTITGSGTVAESSTGIDVPIGVKITDVFVRAGDEVAAGDVLAAVDTDSVATVIDDVTAEMSALGEASAALGGSSTIDRIYWAYDVVLTKLNELYSTGYIRADNAGVIGSVNISKGSTVTAATGAGSNDSSSGTGASGGSGGLGSALLKAPIIQMLAQIGVDKPDEANSGGDGGNSGSGATGDNTGSGNNSGSGATGDTGSGSTGDTGTGSGTGSGNGAATNTGSGNTSDTGNNTANTNQPSDYKISSLPYVTTTVAQVKEKSAAKPGQSSEDAINDYLQELCEAKAWQASQPNIAAKVIVNANDFTVKKGVYTVTFTSANDPTVTTTTYVIVEEDASADLKPPTNNDTSGTGSTDTTGGTGTGTGSTGTGSTGTSGTGNNGTGSSGTGSGTSGTGAGSGEEETVISSTMASAFTLLSNSQMQVTVTLDELDVAATKAGQKATVEVSALEGEQFEGTVSSITSSSGSYYAVITFQRAEGMYSGFSATATIVNEEVTGVVLIPLDAVQQDSSGLYVYTTASEDGELGGQISIQTGLSDATKVEVTSGIDAGTTIYYQQQITNSSATTGTSNSRGTASMPSFSMDGGTVFSGPGGGGGPQSFGR
jgi:multidrug efflux pump subunit AcrA (membrane-fusion protein)